MSSKENLALSLARREKRLKFWQKQFHQIMLAEDKKLELTALFNTYALLISKLVKSNSDTEIKETEERVLGLERELTSLYEAARQLTSSMYAR